jgi:hypothetical protein
MGIPLFLVIWGAGIGIVVMHYMPDRFNKKIIVIAIFTLISILVDRLALLSGYHVHNNFGLFHAIIQDFTAISIFVFLAEGFFGSRVRNR